MFYKRLGTEDDRIHGSMYKHIALPNLCLYGEVARPTGDVGRFLSVGGGRAQS